MHHSRSVTCVLQILSRYGASQRSQRGEQKSMREAMLGVMAFAIGLDRNAPSSSNSHSVSRDALQLNALRTRGLMQINEER